MRFTGLINEKLNSFEIESKVPIKYLKLILKELGGASFIDALNSDSIVKITSHQYLVNFERVRFQQGYFSYNSVILNNFVIWDFDNTELFVRKLEVDCVDEWCSVKLFCSEGESIKAELLNSLLVNNSTTVDAVAQRVCSDGVVSCMNTGFDFVDMHGKNISARSTSVTLYRTIEKMVQLCHENVSDADECFELVNSILSRMLNEIDAFKLIELSPSNLKELRSSNSRYCLLLKPVTHIALFELFLKYWETPKVDALVMYLNGEDFSISDKWVGVLLSHNLTIISKSKDLFVNYVDSILNGDL